MNDNELNEELTEEVTEEMLEALSNNKGEEE